MPLRIDVFDAGEAWVLSQAAVRGSNIGANALRATTVNPKRSPVSWSLVEEWDWVSAYYLNEGSPMRSLD